MVKNSQTQVWISEARRGDPLAVSKLLAICHPILRARVGTQMDRTLRARLEPEDILQQVYLEVFRRFDQFQDRDPDSFRNWVLTILDGKLIDAHRTLHRRKRDVDREVSPEAFGGSGSYWNVLDQLYADSATPSRVVRRDEAVGALMACLSDLSDLHRQVIQLRFLEGRSVNDVAERLDKSPAAVAALTKRALKALRKSMDRLGDFTRGA